MQSEINTDFNPMKLSEAQISHETEVCEASTEETAEQHMSAETNSVGQTQSDQNNVEIREKMPDRHIITRLCAERLYSEWKKEIEVLESIYPGFDIKSELKNKDFVSLIRKNIPIRDAFELTHKREIFESILRYATSSSEERIMSRMNRFSSRENENGSGGYSTVVMKRDVSKLSKKDRADIIKRVKNGETIFF